jgi:hypothetical protein
VAEVGNSTRRRRPVATVAIGLLVALVAVLGGCSQGSGRAVSSAASAGTVGSSSAARPTKMLVIVVENHSAKAATAGLPRLAAAEARYGTAARSFAVAHPSLPNYLAIATGSTFGVHDDRPPAAHRLTGQSVFGQVLAAGKVAKTYAEGMTSNCQAQPSGRYAVKHNPWPYVVAERASCLRYDVPAGSTTRGALHRDLVAGALPTFALLIPDLCHDAHDCSLATADRWLGHWLDALLAGPDFRAGRLAVVVTFDEDDNHAHNQILTAVLHTSLHAKTVRTRFDHLALSRSVSGLVHRGGLRDARRAPNLLTLFGLAPAS